MPRKLKRLVLVFSVAVCAGVGWLFLNRPFYIDQDSQELLETHSVLRIAGNGVEAWASQNGRLPSQAEGLSILHTKQPLVDGWKCALVYRGVPSEGTLFILYSMGPNCLDDKGRGDDIDYWSLRK